MKSFLIYIPVFLFLFTSCRKESLTPIDEVDTESPTEIKGAFFKGKVVGTSSSQANIPVDIYQSEKLVGTVNTDQNGAFNTLGILLDTIGHVTFAVKYGNNRIKAKRVKHVKGKPEIGTIFLGHSNLFQTTQDYLENPGSNDLIVVSGYVRQPSGTAAVADIALLYNISEISPSEFYAEGEVLVSDENGYYEMLVPRDQAFYYYVQQPGCSPRVLTMDETRIFDGFLPVEDIGPFSSDIELPTLNNALPMAEQAINQTISFNVDATNCFGAPLTKGTVSGTITKGNQTFALNDINLESFIQYNQSYCIKSVNQNASWVVKFVIKDLTNNKTSDEKTFTITQANQSLGIVEVCNEITEEKPYVEWTANQVYHYYEIKPGLIDSSGVLLSSGFITSANGLLRFIVPGYTTGGNLMKEFRFLGNILSKPYNFFQKDTDIVQITFINTGNPKKIKGTFEGNIYTSTLDISVPVEGSFLIEIP